MTGTNLDPHLERYARRTAGMRASAMRALFAVASRPEVVSLAGGMPYLASLPLEELAAEPPPLVAEDGLVALQYGSGQGIPRLREQICQVMSLEGIDAHPDDVVVTVGSQMALDLTTRIFFDPGDVILAEAPSYVGALTTFTSYQAHVVHVAMDDDGLIPEALATAIERSGRPAAGSSSSTRSRTSTTRPASRWPTTARPRSAEICRDAGIPILEDNPYGLLGSTTPCTGRSAPTIRRTSSTSAPSPRRSPPGCGSAGCWRRTPSGRSWCWPTRRATLNPPVFNQMLVSRYL